MSDTDDIAAKLDILIRLAAIGLCGEKPQKEKIGILASAGLPPKEIASILDTTPNTVSVALTAIKKRKKSTKKSTGGD